MEALENAVLLKAELDKLRPLNAEREAKVMQKLRLDWNYHSNNLEGNSLTYGETKALILFGITAQGKPLKDHFEITGHDDAIKWVYEIVNGDRDLSENFIRELHTLLLKESHEKKAITTEGIPTTRRIEVGKYKTQPNHVLTKTGEIFYFASPEETPALMHDLLNWYREKITNKETNPILLAAEFHYKFIRIHPFDDGNGRVARILMNFILLKAGYPPVIIKTNDKENYYSVLQQADAGIIEPFISYIAINLVRSLEIMIAAAKGENIEEPDDLDKELALLEKRIEGLGNKLEQPRSQKSILEIYDVSIARLWQSYINSCMKFEKLYLSIESYLFINGISSPADSAKVFELNRSHINDTTTGISIWTDFKELNQAALSDSQYQSMLSVEFKLGGYKIFTPQKIQIEKPYTEQLTDAEIDMLVKAETRRHMEYIEQKLKEAEQKK